MKYLCCCCASVVQPHQCHPGPDCLHYLQILWPLPTGQVSLHHFGQPWADLGGYSAYLPGLTLVFWEMICHCCYHPGVGWCRQLQSERLMQIRQPNLQLLRSPAESNYFFHFSRLLTPISMFATLKETCSPNRLHTFRVQAENKKNKRGLHGPVTFLSALAYALNSKQA